jgi:hypothetical protein
MILQAWSLNRFRGVGIARIAEVGGRGNCPVRTTRGAEPGEAYVADPEMFDNWLKLQEKPENREAAESLLDKFRDYQDRTARQMLLGNYTDDVTLLDGSFGLF